MSPDFRVVIPARFGSTRLPGKPLLEIAGLPLIVHVWNNAVRAGAVEVVVATDDERIHRVVENAGGRALMTSPRHASGTDRLAEVAEVLRWPDEAIVVNLQGDEPMIPGAVLEGLASALESHPDAGIATMATPVQTSADLFSPQIVKVTVDRQGFALYFSRAPIPWVRDAFGSRLSPAATLPEGVPFLRHLGLYAYRVSTLRRLRVEPAGTYERVESLEQLRALEMGIRIHVTTLSDAPSHGVDTEADLERVRAAMLSA